MGKLRQKAVDRALACCDNAIRDMQAVTKELTKQPIRPVTQRRIAEALTNGVIERYHRAAR